MEKKKILIADDDMELLELLATSLEREGYDVKTALDGTKAEGLLQEENFDLLILDIMLPGETGLHVATAAAALPKPPKIMTISGRRNITEGQLTWAGVDMHIDKPFDPDNLLDNVQKLLQ